MLFRSVSLTDAGSRLPPEVRQFLASWFAGGDKTDPPAGAQLRLIPCSTAAQRSLLPGFAVRNIGLITKTGVLQLGRTAIAFAPESFGDPQYEALYGSDFL